VDAVGKAVEKLGTGASRPDIQGFLKNEFGLDIGMDHISNCKLELRARGAKANKAAAPKAIWSSPEASGLMSLVWRHVREATRQEQYTDLLLRYNREDCEAARVLLARLVQIKETATSEPAGDFAHRPKQTATGVGRQMHQQLERILRHATEDGERQSVRIRVGDTEAEGNGHPVLPPLILPAPAPVACRRPDLHLGREAAWLQGDEVSGKAERVECQ
jgi:hypothetical protein